jgi:hypothetical protein
VGKGGPVVSVVCIALGAAFAHAVRTPYPLSKDDSFRVGKIAAEVGVRDSSGGPSAQETVVGVEAFSGLALGTPDLRLLKLRCDRSHDTGGHVILQIQNVTQGAVEAICPQMRTDRCIDKLPGDSKAIRRLTDAAFDKAPRIWRRRLSRGHFAAPVLCYARS